LQKENFGFIFANFVKSIANQFYLCYCKIYVKNALSKVKFSAIRLK
jgi:hypothetical protein